MARSAHVTGYCESSPHGTEACANKGRYRLTETGKLSCARHTLGEPCTDLLTGERVRGLGRRR